MTQKQRNANLDLLRIVSMLLIVFLHSIDHSGVLEHAENCGGAMYFYVRFTYALCQVCVNIYIMLSGYFMVTSKFRLQKLVTLWMEAAFYSFVLKLLFMVTGQDAFSITSLVSCFFPILTGRYWFLTIYVGMYLVSPFLNTLIRAMDKLQPRPAECAAFCAHVCVGLPAPVCCRNELRRWLGSCVVRDAVYHGELAAAVLYPQWPSLALAGRICGHSHGNGGCAMPERTRNRLRGREALVPI